MPYFIAAKITPDSVIAYHTAMMVRGNAYSMLSQHYYMSQNHVRDFHYRHQAYKAIAPPKILVEQNVPFIETEIINILDQKIKVTSLERTLVDSLDNPFLAGGWEELWRNFDNIHSFEWEKLLAYTQLLGKAILSAKLGLYLSLRQEKGLRVPDELLAQLAIHAPNQALYIDAKNRFAPHQAWRLMKPWQLIVPDELLTQSWEEVYMETE